ncbi:uncharacterized protein C8R40DRAFT_560296 [Lentinula edodes]|uniref:uncharacterized protein n=1 Tax=Lentinula edodes TaxID=5353 RepID=UPI001E8DE4D9|nr:uncharacterized protein C8R40DRAFT_560296 [Lentinula edodes]KAH7871513.1 hypothetical protein C8R40DRAFT_560296 [Lentinula edodes]
MIQLTSHMQLLVENAHERLSGQDVKDHPFFESISNSWNEVAALEHPPLPGPPTTSLDPDISLGIALSPRICSSTYDDRSLVASLSQSTGNEGRSLHECNQLNSPSSLNITWSVPSEGLLVDDPIDSSLVAPDRSSNDENTDIAHNLRETVSTSVNTLDEESFLFIHSDEEANQGGEEEEATEDGMSNQISPLQSFPSTASLHFVFPAPGQVNQDLGLDSVEHESQPVMNANSEAEMGVDDDEENADDVEVWNPWNPRPFDGLLDPTDSLPSVLPNPYSPRPTLVYGPESAHEFQSLHGVASLDSQSKTDYHVTSAESAKPSVTGDTRRETGDESIPTGDTSTPGRNMDNHGTENSRLKSNTIDITSVSSLAVKEVREGEDILFFSANIQPRRKSISIPLDKKTRGKRSFSRFSLSVRLPNHKFTEHSSVNTTINSPRSVVEGGNPFECPLIDTRSNARKKRFSFPASFSGSESKGEKGQKEETKRQEQCSISATNNSRRRFSAPLSFPSRGPPSSFDATKVKLRQKSHILSGMSSRSQNVPTNEKPASNPALSPAQFPRATGGGGGGISVLPFPAHELDRMRIEYQNRRATDPIPMPCTPRIRSVNGYAHTATLGRSTGTRMMAQAQALALQRGHHSEQGARRAPSVASRAKHGHTHSQSSHNSTGTGNLSPFLQNELTMAVLGAMESKGSESRDFTTMNTIRSGTCRSKARTGISASVRAQSLRQGQEAVSTEWRLEQNREPATSGLAAIPATLPRKERASWAGMVRTISRNHDRQLEQSTKAKPIHSTPRLASVRKGKLGEAGNLEELGSGVCSAGEGKVGSAFEDPCHRLSISHNQPDSEHSHHGSQIPYKRAESNRMEKSRVDDATRQRSLGSRLWKKLKQIVFL